MYNVYSEVLYLYLKKQLRRLFWIQSPSVQVPLSSAQSRPGVRLPILPILAKYIKIFYMYFKTFSGKQRNYMFNVEWIWKPTEASFGRTFLPITYHHTSCAGKARMIKCDKRTVSTNEANLFWSTAKHDGNFHQKEDVNEKMSVMWFSSLQVCRFNLDHRELFRKQERQQAARQKDTKSIKIWIKMWQFRVESASTVTKWRSRISTILDLFKMSKIRDFPISYVHLHTSFFAIPLQSPQPPMTLSRVTWSKK